MTTQYFGWSLSIFMLFMVVSCQEKTHKTDYTGQEVSFIKGDTIYLKSGSDFVMDSVKKVFYLIRHAEKDSFPVDNPGLTARGFERATALSDVLRGTRVDAIYSTFFTRTLFTVDSLADIKVMSILPYEQKNLRKLVDEIDADESKKAIVIVGHSNSTPALANTLAGREVFKKTFDDSEYNDFVVVIEKLNGQKEVLPLKYNIKE